MPDPSEHLTLKPGQAMRFECPECHTLVSVVRMPSRDVVITHGPGKLKDLECSGRCPQDVNNAKCPANQLTELSKQLGGEQVTDLRKVSDR